MTGKSGKCWENFSHLVQLSCLDPHDMAGSPEQGKTMMRHLLSVCVEGGFVVEADCDEVMQQFDDFFTRVKRWIGR